jgi:succinoglycan biosynthesis transport protein ExoP
MPVDANTGAGGMTVHFHDGFYRIPAMAGHELHQDRRVGELPEFSILNAFGAVWRRKGLFASVVVLVIAMAAGAVSWLPELYKAEGAIILEQRGMNMPELQPLVSNLTITPEVGRSEARVMASRTVLDQVVQSLGLERDPEFNPWLRSPAEERFPLVQQAIDMLGLARPEAQQMPSPAAVRETVIKELSKHLSIRNDERSLVLSIEYASESPERSAEIVNAVMNFYLADQLAQKEQALANANGWLGERLNALRSELQEADTKVQEHRSSTLLLRTESGNLAARQVEQVNQQLSEISAAREAAASRAAQARTLMSAGAANRSGAEALSRVLESAVIENLREREAALVQQAARLAADLGPRHPSRLAATAELNDITRRIRAEIMKVISNLDQEARVLAERQKVLQARLAGLEKTAQEAARAEVALQDLERDAETKRQMYENFMTVVMQTTTGGTLQRPDARIMSAAVAPLEAYSPQWKALLALSAVAGLLLATVAALIADWRDDRILSLEGASAATKRRGFGAIPLVRRRGKGEALSLHVLEKPDSIVVETLRGLRLHLIKIVGRNCVIMVTSSEAGEGKTSLTGALGRVAANDGERVLLVECDLRRSTFRDCFDTRGSVGIESVLAGEASWEDAITIEEQTGLHVIACQSYSKSASKLLRSEQLSIMLAQARQYYDLILVDTPPVMRVPDALNLSVKVDATLMLVGWKQVRQRTVMEAMGRLEGAGHKVAGVILTKVEGRLSKMAVYHGYDRHTHEHELVRRLPTSL